MNCRAFPSVYMGEGSVSVVTGISQLLKLKTASLPTPSLFFFFSTSLENDPFRQTECVVIQNRLLILMCLYHCFSAVICGLWFSYCITNGATAMQVRWPVSDADSLCRCSWSHLIVSSHIIIIFWCLFLSFVFVFCTESLWLIFMPVLIPWKDTL